VSQHFPFYSACSEKKKNELTIRIPRDLERCRISLRGRIMGQKVLDLSMAGMRRAQVSWCISSSDLRITGRFHHEFTTRLQSLLRLFMTSLVRRRPFDSPDSTKQWAEHASGALFFGNCVLTACLQRSGAPRASSIMHTLAKTSPKGDVDVLEHNSLP
jgi:hypothetical protein